MNKGAFREIVVDKNLPGNIYILYICTLENFHRHVGERNVVVLNKFHFTHCKDAFSLAFLYTNYISRRNILLSPKYSLTAATAVAMVSNTRLL